MTLVCDSFLPSAAMVDLRAGRGVRAASVGDGSAAASSRAVPRLEAASEDGSSQYSSEEGVDGLVHGASLRTSSLSASGKARGRENGGDAYLIAEEDERTRQPSYVRRWAFIVLVLCLLYIGLFLTWGILIDRPETGLLTLITIAPASVVVRFYFYRLFPDDVFDLAHFLKVFAFGMVGAAPAAVIEYFIMVLVVEEIVPEKKHDRNYAEKMVAALLGAYVVAAWVEETLKYYLTARALYLFRRPGEVVLYALAGTLGFAMIENTIYVFMSAFDADVPVEDAFALAILRAILTVPLHCLTGLWIGVNLARRIFYYDHMPYYKAIALPIFLHGTFDFALMAPKSYAVPGVGVVVVFLIDILGFLVLHKYKLPQVRAPILSRV